MASESPRRLVDAAAFAPGLDLPNSQSVRVARYADAGPGEPGSVMVVEWELDGMRLVEINGGPQFTFSEAMSLHVRYETQEEIDDYGDALTDGGEEGPRGWLKDRYGISGQVTPTGMDEFFSGTHPEGAKRATEAKFGMKKLDTPPCTPPPPRARRRLRSSP